LCVRLSLVQVKMASVVLRNPSSKRLVPFSSQIYSRCGASVTSSYSISHSIGGDDLSSSTFGTSSFWRSMATFTRKLVFFPFFASFSLFRSESWKTGWWFWLWLLCLCNCSCGSKPHVNVGTIGHVDHGKTTLTAAITKVLLLCILVTWNLLSKNLFFF